MIFEEQLLTETLYIQSASTSHVNKDNQLTAFRAWDSPSPGHSNTADEVWN